MAEETSSKASEASAVSSSHIGEQLATMGREQQLAPYKDSTSELHQEESLEDLEGNQMAAVILTREQFNQGIRIHNAEVREAGHPSQAIEPIWGTAQVIDEYGNKHSGRPSE